MTNLSSKVLKALEGKTLATAESCTGGGVGAALTAVPGSSAVFKGGIIAYTDEMKYNLLGVRGPLLLREGAVSEKVAAAMAKGAREKLQTDVAVSVTGLAGPDGDDRGNPVGLVYIGYSDSRGEDTISFLYSGNREEIRAQAVKSALEFILIHNY